nr:hypothetical protein Iba_chr11dCG10280 [Ipomoea batatas]
MAIGESLRFDVAMVSAVMVGGCLRSFYGSRSVRRSPVEAAFGVGEDGCSAIVAVAEEREAFGVGSRKWRVARGGGCYLVKHVIFFLESLTWFWAPTAPLSGPDQILPFSRESRRMFSSPPASNPTDGGGMILESKRGGKYIPVVTDCKIKESEKSGFAVGQRGGGGAEHLD